MDYELINEINDNDAKEIEELREEYENEEISVDYELKEGCIINGALGIYIPYNVVLFAIQMGFNPSNEWKQCVERAQEQGQGFEVWYGMRKAESSQREKRYAD